MNYINSFNQAILALYKQDPAERVIQFIQKYKHLKGYEDYYTTMDNLSSIVGVDINASEVIDKNERTIGYDGFIVFKPHNILKREANHFYINRYNSIEDCYSKLAAEQVYKFRDIIGLEKLGLI